MIAAIATSALAQTSIDGDFSLSNSNRRGSITGEAIGTNSIPTAVVRRPSDSQNQECLGFSSMQPNHLLTLQTPIPNLALKVDSGSADTTIAVQGPNGLLLCGDDDGTGGSSSASVTLGTWPAGTYQIWVGTFAAGGRVRYRLSAQ
ncbi:MAG: hypothetical protein EA001_10780 [Oscillatoriales cyanobacterium]|nr:MAG: hypothetical protein EA001_10780 [Oscillatoriales cyanobacterium]